MALTGIQRTICRLIAANRIASGESYVAGGVALNELLGGARISRAWLSRRRRSASHVAATAASES